MKKLFTTPLALSLILLMAVSTPMTAFAGKANQATSSTTQSISERLESQEKKIKEGVKLGQITKAEKRTLNKEQSAIKKQIKKLTKSGKLSEKDQAKIHSKLDKATLNIYRLRYNQERD